MNGSSFCIKISDWVKFQERAKCTIAKSKILDNKLQYGFYHGFIFGKGPWPDWQHSISECPTMYYFDIAWELTAYLWLAIRVQMGSKHTACIDLYVW